MIGRPVPSRLSIRRHAEIGAWVMGIRGKAAERLSRRAVVPPSAEKLSTVLIQRISAGALRRPARLQGPDLPAEAQSAAGKPVDAEHLEDLEAQMDLLRVAIDLESRADYGDPQGAQQRNRTSFLAHFAGLGPALEEWDAIVERMQAAPGSVWEWFEKATSERGFTEPPFAVGPLVDLLAMLTVKRARYGQLDTPDRLYLQQFESISTRGRCVSVYVEGQNIAQLPAEPAATVQARIEAVGRRIQALFDDAQSCRPAEEVASARDSLLAVKQPLLDLLALHASVEAVASAIGCPLCQKRREQDAEGLP
jgi:hypothetical protein